MQSRYDIRIVTLPAKPGSLLGLFRNFLTVLVKARGIVHITGDCHYVAWMVPWRRSILTIHDVNYLERLQGLKERVFRVLWFSWPLECSNAVTVISPSTYEKVASLHCFLKKKITIVENCLTETAQKDISKIAPSIERLQTFWILQIGSGAHKNLSALVEAVKGTDYGIWIVGSPSDKSLSEIKSFGIPLKVEESVSEERLIEIFKGADALYFCSLSEGFGLPIIEAQAVGLPVVTSNLSSMPWVAGDGAALVNPHSSLEIRDAFDRIANDSNFRNDLVRKGNSNVRRFSVKEVAKKYIAIYEDVSQDKRFL